SRISIRFEAMAKPNFASFQNVAPPWVKQTGWRVENRGLVIEFSADPGSPHPDFRDSGHIVLDVLSPKSDADAYKPPGLEKADVKLNAIGGAAQTATAAPAIKPGETG